ncbi:nucleolar and coiled-body phosphoprotein 1-like [Impatiens glandulifera]|uniref:nucleolar and coiled-body phosphoprotein 1-like n=1 Tax=Impatiens glandulifera TaxID=253017 RepID=UPI001FB16665|nr:nucleolar and coiled-body phosphoprotein 1-like [Impatiens glandulifera]
MADEGEGGGILKRLDWTTWDELLLACAVERHGSKDWDLVAIELQARSSLPLTAQTCKGKFIDLNRRFMNEDGGGNAAAVVHSSSVPWIEDLRKLRVAELRQEVHLHDLSIQKLQLKVKRLEEKEEEEEEEEKLKVRGDDNSNDDEKPDLMDVSHVDNNNKREDVDEASPETAVRDGSDRENLSFNESNSSQNRSRETEPVEKLNRVTSDSSNDSSDTIAKHAPPLPPPTSKANQAEKSGKSATNSKKGNKDLCSSDVQSSASLSKKKRRLGNEPVVSPATIKQRREAVKSEPLVAFLDVIRSHKHGSLFERRLDNQKTEEYNEIIRQHIDLETIRRKVAAKSSSYYSSDASKFYRDVLLLFTNIITVFPKSSKESLAALQLRTLVLKEISEKMTNLQKPGLSIDSDDTNTAAQPDPDKPNTSLLTKNRPTSTPIVVCRKRSSISAAKSTAAAKDLKEDDSPPVKVKSKEKPVTGTRSLRKGIKSRAASKPPSPSEDKSVPSSPEPDQKKITTTTSSSRKKGAADFLKRIKKNASPAKGNTTNSSLLERLRSDDAASNKKGSGGGGDRRKELPKRGVVKQTKEESPPPPPTKKPAAGKSQPVRRGREGTSTRSGGAGGGSAVATKRRRDEGDTNTTAKKRTRR